MFFPCFHVLPRSVGCWSCERGGSTAALLFSALCALLILCLSACEPAFVADFDAAAAPVSPHADASALEADDASARVDAAGAADASDGASDLLDAAAKEAGPGSTPADAAASDAAPVALDAGRSDAGGELPTDAGADAQRVSFPPFVAAGPPLEAKNGAWTYFEFPDTTCRDGSHAGVALSLRQPSSKLLIYLEGGVYCYDELFCTFNPARVDDPLFNSAKAEPTDGIFDRKNTANPVRDWNIVYVPYCSGDGHGGTKSVKTDVPDGPEGQLFSGQLNLEKFLRRVAPTFKDASDVLLVGMSAGGFGVLQSLVLVQRAFPWLKVRHINDSGPPLSKAMIPTCLQQKFLELWGFDKGSLAYCGASCPNHDDYVQDNSLFLARTFADRPSGFIDSEEDEPMRMMFATGLRDCTGSFLFDDIPAAAFRADLLNYRDKLKAFAAYGTFIARGGQHTWLRNNTFYTEAVGDTKLVDWFAKIARGESAGHVGP